jgi:hypothetical protein
MDHKPADVDEGDKAAECWDQKTSTKFLLFKELHEELAIEK